jgi:hypothetical protein
VRSFPLRQSNFIRINDCGIIEGPLDNAHGVDYRGIWWELCLVNDTLLAAFKRDAVHFVFQIDFAIEEGQDGLAVRCYGEIEFRATNCPEACGVRKRMPVGCSRLKK